MTDNLLSELDAARYSLVPLCHQAAARIRELEADLARVTEAGEAMARVLRPLMDADPSGKCNCLGCASVRVVRRWENRNE